MIKLSLDRHDFLYALEGFAYGSHLRQHVWRTMVYASIPQMSVEDMDYFWFFLRRDFFGSYFREKKIRCKRVLAITTLCTFLRCCIAATDIR